MTHCRAQLALLAALACSARAGLEEREGEEVSLLQHQAHISSHVSRAVYDTVYHLHIPKVAGISFGADSLEILGQDSVKLASREGCFAWGDTNPRIRGTAMMLRSPRKHVLSMFDFCHEDIIKPYLDAVRPPNGPGLPDDFKIWLQSWADLQKQGWHGDFTPSAGLASASWYEQALRSYRISAWSRPPFSPEERTLSAADWPRLDGGGTLWHFVDVPFQCYVPISLQAQRLSCDRPLNYSAMPSAELAIRNMHSVFFVGLVESYQASLCLFHAKLGHELPAYCDCRRPELWNSFDGQKENVNEHKTAFEDFPQEVVELVDELTVADRQLYQAGRKRFLREISEVEKERGVQILCDDAKRKLLEA